MSNEPAMFPEHEPSNTRYQARRQTGPWTIYEDHVMVLTLAACPNDGAHVRCAQELCRLFRREPTYAPGIKPDAARYAQDCVDVFEARRWKLLRQGLAAEHHPRWRAGDEPLTYGERALFVRKYHGVARKQTVYPNLISLSRLSSLLGRRHGLLIIDQMTWLDENPNAADPPDVNRPDPSKRLPELARCINDYMRLETSNTATYVRLRSFLGL